MEKQNQNSATSFGRRANGRYEPSVQTESFVSKDGEWFVTKIIHTSFERTSSVKNKLAGVNTQPVSHSVQASPSPAV